MDPHNDFQRVYNVMDEYELREYILNNFRYLWFPPKSVKNALVISAKI